VRRFLLFTYFKKESRYLQASAFVFIVERSVYGFGGVELPPGAGALTGCCGELAPAGGITLAGVLALADGTMVDCEFTPGDGATVARSGVFAVGNELPAGSCELAGWGVVAPPGRFPKVWLFPWFGGLVIEKSEFVAAKPLLLKLPLPFGLLFAFGVAGVVVGGIVSPGVCAVVGSGVAAVGARTGPTTVPPATPPAPLHIAVMLLIAARRRIFAFIRQ
jgi:hypothetical protein